MKQFDKEIGTPDAFVADMSGEQMSKEVKTFCNDTGRTLRAMKEGTPWSNKAELYIGLMKEPVRKDMREANSPMVFWDYCLERRAWIHNLMAKSNFKLHGSNANTVTTGEEGDISSLCQFVWYEWCYFHEHTAAFPTRRKCWGGFLVLPEVMEMRCANGCSNPMAGLFQGDLCGSCKLQNSTVLNRSNFILTLMP